MAKVTAQMPDDFIRKMSALGERTDEIAEEVLKAGGEVVLKKVRSNFHASVGGGTKYPSRATGELESSLGLSPAKVNKNGDYDVKIGFAEPHSGGVSNAKLASIIEYGKSGQKARPFLKPAKSASKAECIEAMKAKLESEVGSL